jgi:glycerol uptake facilitator protein
VLREVLGEFVGTAVMMLLGNGVNAAFTLKGTKAWGGAAPPGSPGWLAVATGWAFAVFCGVVTATACGSPGANLNPAVTLAAAVHTGSYGTLGWFALAQLAGAFVGATGAWLFYFPHWAVTNDPDGKLGVFCTGPAIRNYGWNFFSEAVATFVLLLVIAAVGSKVFAFAGPAPGLAPFLVAIVVWSVGLSLGATTGYAINPARDLGPRLAHAIWPVAGKGGSDWSYAWVPILGPLTGAVAAGWAIRALGM